MKIKEITVSAGLKISKNYNTTDSHVAFTAEVSEVDYLTEYEELSIIVHDLVGKEVQKGLKEIENNTINKRR